VFFLSPVKLLVILVVATVVLGPDTLPGVARRIGGLWSEFIRFRQALDSEVRASFPDLPSTETISRAVRSPLGFLDTLAGSQGSESGAVTTTEPVPEPEPVYRLAPLAMETATAPEPRPTGRATVDAAAVHHRLTTAPAAADAPGLN
jgi:Sec-independent protein translocase protein TatA